MENISEREYKEHIEPKVIELSIKLKNEATHDGIVKRADLDRIYHEVNDYKKRLIDEYLEQHKLKGGKSKKRMNRKGKKRVSKKKRVSRRKKTHRRRR